MEVKQVQTPRGDKQKAENVVLDWILMFMDLNIDLLLTPLSHSEVW